MELVEFACIDISQPMSMAELAEILLPLESEGRQSSSICRLRHRCLAPPVSVFAKLVLFCPEPTCCRKAARHNRASSLEINNELLSVFRENQIYRIDHYLGKETVQTLALRFANVIFEALWNNRYIDNIQITVAETLGVGDRANYYDNYGAIRDAPEPPFTIALFSGDGTAARFNADQVRNEKLRVLQALRPVKRKPYPRPISGLPHEVGATTSTETYVA